MLCLQRAGTRLLHTAHSHPIASPNWLPPVATAAEYLPALLSCVIYAADVPPPPTSRCSAVLYCSQGCATGDRQLHQGAGECRLLASAAATWVHKHAITQLLSLWGTHAGHLGFAWLWQHPTGLLSTCRVPQASNAPVPLYNHTLFGVRHRRELGPFRREVSLAARLLQLSPPQPPLASHSLEEHVAAAVAATRMEQGGCSSSDAAGPTDGLSALLRAAAAHLVAAGAVGQRAGSAAGQLEQQKPAADEPPQPAEPAPAEGTPELAGSSQQQAGRVGTPELAGSTQPEAGHAGTPGGDGSLREGSPCRQGGLAASEAAEEAGEVLAAALAAMSAVLVNGIEVCWGREATGAAWPHCFAAWCVDRVCSPCALSGQPALSWARRWPLPLCPSLGQPAEVTLTGIRRPAHQLLRRTCSTPVALYSMPQPASDLLSSATSPPPSPPRPLSLAVTAGRPADRCGATSAPAAACQLQRPHRPVCHGLSSQPLLPPQCCLHDRARGAAGAAAAV